MTRNPKQATTQAGAASLLSRGVLFVVLTLAASIRFRDEQVRSA